VKGDVTVLEMVISGGQTGVDQAALRAARAAGIATGGWAPRGFLTEDGPAPWLAGFGLKEAARPGYPARTGLNVRQSDATLLFHGGGTGSALTVLECQRQGKPLRVLRVTTHGGVAVLAPAADAAGDVASWVRANGVRVLNVAGARESKAPGVSALAERFLSLVFALLREGVPPC
jgi:hypothetical protein